MNILFVHQNYPGQYKHLVSSLRARREGRVVFITQSEGSGPEGLERVVYAPGHPPSVTCHPYTVEIDRAVRTGLAVAEAARTLKAKGFSPDLVVGHNGWGEMLFLKDIFPDAPVLSYFEFYYHAANVDVGFDPEFGANADPLRLRTRNAVTLMGFDAADWGNTPTHWQRRLHPPEMRPRLSVLHEGVDTNAVRPDPDAWLFLERGRRMLDRKSEVVTYVARNLEPYRGFHIFMRTVALLQKARPGLEVIVVGGDEVSYGRRPPDGRTYREVMLAELQGRLDLDRLHFLGRVPYETYLKVLQISTAHVYLTYPFVLSWSFLEAMASGCALVASDTPPVLEAATDRETALLVDFHAPEEIAERTIELLENADLRRSLGAAARARVQARYDLKSRTLPAWMQVLEDLRARRRPPLLPGGGSPEAA